MKPRRNRQDSKKSYNKPQLKKIQLRPEESLSAGCKSVSAAGPEAGVPPCTGVCLSIGS